MPDTFLIVDVSFIAYRNFYAMGDLSHEGAKTGVPFGVFRDILSFQDTHQTDKIIFCFDGGYSVRSAIYPEYKLRREPKEVDEELIEAKGEVARQLRLLRTKYLPKIGFRNILWQLGYEADDLIAEVCRWIKPDDVGVMVSSDQDLYQLLDGDRIILWNPRTHTPTTEASFRREWGIGPECWATVKSIAGCSSDSVPGVNGVGEKTAIKFLKGELNRDGKKFTDIVHNSALRERNLKLVTLPFPGVDPFRHQKDRVTVERWEWVLNKLGVKSLMKRMGAK